MYSFGVFIFISIVISASATSLPPKTAIPTTTPVGCTYEGQFYPPGEIYADPNGCYGVVCDPSGFVYYWDNFYCGSTTPLPTTVPPTTTPPRGCYYNGQFYPPGEIENGSDGQGWCYGTYCTDDYHVVSWDNFNCGPTTTLPPTTIPPHPTSFPPISK